MKTVNKVLDYAVLTAAAAIFAAAISLFLDPNGLAPGGVSGIAVILNRSAGLPVGAVIFAINLPLLVTAFIKIGRKFAVRTLYTTAVSSLLTDLSEKYLSGSAPLTSDLLLAAMSGGVLMAVAMGIAYRFGGSTGGTDIVTRLIRKRARSVKTGIIYLATDALIITASAVVFGNIDTALYSAVSVTVTSILLDRILYATDEAKLVFVITACHETIAGRLLKEIGIGATYLDGDGAYTMSRKKILFCAVHKHDFYRVKDTVSKEDPSAFMIVADASEIYGKGYKRHGTDEL